MTTAAQLLGRRPRLLLVEDEPDARSALARALGRAGYDVVPAGTLEEATAEIDSPRKGHSAPIDIDIAVLDLVLGDDDRGGLRVLERLRARSASVPVVMVTAFADLPNVKSALNLGASHLLEKPFRAASLLTVLDRLLTVRPDPTEAVLRAFARAGLTPRESEVALLALKGLSSPEIAQVLTMSDKTVRQHLTKVYEKHGVHSRGELVHLLFPV